MIREGYAREYTYKSNPYSYQAEFMEAQTEARAQKLGLWQDGACRDVI
jgi:endonuclease YncB( thermonuclease family)